MVRTSFNKIFDISRELTIMLEFILQLSVKWKKLEQCPSIWHLFIVFNGKFGKSIDRVFDIFHPIYWVMKRKILPKFNLFREYLNYQIPMSFKSKSFEHLNPMDIIPSTKVLDNVFKDIFSNISHFLLSNSNLFQVKNLGKYLSKLQMSSDFNEKSGKSLDLNWTFSIHSVTDNEQKNSSKIQPCSGYFWADSYVLYN